MGKWEMGWEGGMGDEFSREIGKVWPGVRYYWQSRSHKNLKTNHNLDAISSGKDTFVITSSSWQPLESYKKMEFDTLNFTLEHLASVGKAFSFEHGLTLKSTLTSLCHEKQFQTVHFWGIIYGIENDYMLAYGIGQDYLKDRSFFYSLNGGLDWIPLLQPTDEIIGFALASCGPFQGDPEAVSLTDLVPDDQDDVEESEGDDIWVRFKEEERLAGIVATINAEAAIVPRGSLLKSPAGLVQRNYAFEGLDKEDALQPISYSHLRRPEAQWDKNLISRPVYNISLDFLDSIANDIPIGCWTFTMDPSESVATARSHFWPGAFCSTMVKNSKRVHTCGWNLTLWWYTGTGRKNWDFPFMIPPVGRAAKAAINEFDRYAVVEDKSTGLVPDGSVKLMFEGNSLEGAYSTAIGLISTDEEEEEDEQGQEEKYAAPPAPAPSQYIGLATGNGAN